MRSKLSLTVILLLVLTMLSASGQASATPSSQRNPVVFDMYNPDADNSWVIIDMEGKTTYYVAGFCIGFTEGSEWIDTYLDFPDGDYTFEFWSQTENVGTLSGNFFLDDVTEAAFFDVSDGDIDSDSAEPLIGIIGDFNPIPSQPEMLDDLPDGSIDLLEDALADEFPDDSIGEILDIYSIDLDGDESSETIVLTEISGSFYDGYNEEPGDGMDWVAFMISDTGDKPDVQVMDTEVYIFDYFAFGDTLAAFFDLNDDGVMEVIVYEEYYEWTTVTVYEFDGDTIREVLISGYGV